MDIRSPDYSFDIGFDFDAEVLVETGGETIFHLANWANTHVPGQIRLIQVDRPEITPAKDHLERVIIDANTMASQRRAEQALVQKQRSSEA